MKKLTALLLVLCMVLCCVSALAEALHADGSPVEFDDFVMNLEEGVVYQKTEKQTGDVFVMVYPFAASEDFATSMNASWVGARPDLTPEEVKEDLEGIKAGVEKGVADMGYSLDSYECTDPVETDLGGAKCIVSDIVMKLSLDSLSINTYQRAFCFGEKGYIFNVSASSPETPEAAAAWFGSVLVWR